MNKKENKLISNLLWVSLVVGIIILVIISGNYKSTSSQQAEYSMSNLFAIENSFDFDTISMKDGNVDHKFEIKNDGEEPIIIEKVYTSCMCTTAVIIDAFGKERGSFGMPGHGGSPKTSVEVGVGESITVDAVFDPNAHGPSGVGLAQRSIYLETNSANSPKLELTFQAMVVK